MKTAKINLALHWKTHTPNLLREILNNKGTEILTSPLNIFQKQLAMVAERASELNDPVLNSLMCDLTLYEVADPQSKEYDPKLVEFVRQQAEKARAESAS